MPKILKKENRDVKNDKGRNWAFVVYPESLPENWLEILKLSGLKIAISPLHDADLNADETEKKPHYHIIAIWENGSATYNLALELSKRVNGTIPIKLFNIRGYYRYFTHEDNPEKTQYDKNEIKLINGFSITDFVELTGIEKLKIKMDIFKLIKEINIREYEDLLEYLLEIDRWDYLQIVSTNTIFFNAILKSRRYKQICLDLERNRPNYSQ